MGVPVQSSYKFGAFRLDPAGRELRHGSKRLDLPPRVFDTLVALVEEKGNLVVKDRLMRTVWPDTVVEENNLSQAVYLLRKILHEGESGARFIETVPKQGYRFVARVREVVTDTDEDAMNILAGNNGSVVQNALPAGPENGSAPPAIKPQADTTSLRADESAPSARWPLWVGVLCGTVAVLLLLVIVRVATSRGSRQEQSDLGSLRSVAVLPLQNLSNDPEQEYFADGMTDQLITDLAQVRELRVVSKTSVMQYKGAHRSLPQIGRELGVDAVVEGSVLRSGNRVRITAQLIQTATDSHLWAKSYEGEIKDILSLQALVAEAITSEVKLSLSVAERDRLHRSRPVNPEAYEAYLKGRYSWNRRN